MQPNFIDALPSGPSWAPWLVLGLTLAAFVAWPALYVWTKRRAFWRDRKASDIAENGRGGGHVKGPLINSELDFMASDWMVLTNPAPRHEIWVYLVREGEQPTGRAAVLLAEGWRPGGTTVWGVTSPRLRYEYGMAWLTRLRKGAGPVYEIAVREKPGDPEGAKVLAHELAHHVWPHLHGSSMRGRDLAFPVGHPDHWRGHANVKTGGRFTWEVEDRLLEGLGVE